MRKVILILLWCIPLLSGCWDRVEIQNLAIITAAGIDQLEDGQIRVSVQIFIPRTITSGETGEDPSTGSTFVREGLGNNLASAISMLQLNVPRRLFWGHCKVFIFGEELANNGIRKEIDYLARYPGTRGGSYIFVSEGNAKKILTLVPPLERYSVEALKKLTEEEIGLVTTLKDVDKSLIDEGRGVDIPYIKTLVTKDTLREPHETIPIINGAAIFHHDQLKGILDSNEMKNFLWLKDEVTKGVISVKKGEDDEEITLKVSSGKMKYKPKIEDDRWIMDISFSVKGQIIQNETHLTLLEEGIISELEKEFEKIIIEDLNLVMTKLQQELNADVLNFGRKFHEKYPKEWKKAKSEWDEKYTEVEIKMESSVNILDPGYIGPPAALPEDEVKE